MGLAGDDRVAVPQPHPDQGARPFDPARGGAREAEVIALRREPPAQRLEREHAERERLLRELLERRRRERLERRRRERQALRSRRRSKPAAPRPSPQPRQPAPVRAAPTARVEPSVTGPVRKRRRAAENRRRQAARRGGLLWPTAKAGLAVTVVMAVCTAVGSALGLPLPGLDTGAGHQSLASSGSPFTLDAGTPTGLAPGYVFPVMGKFDFGTGIDRFGAPRYGHMHEGQDIFGKVGTPEVAVHDGVVVDRGKENGRYSGGRGNYLAIYSPADNHSFVYMHMLNPPLMQLGQHVHAGQVIGQLGCSGSCDGPHLHFEVRIGKASLRAETKALDPLPFLRQWPQATPG
jgi:murein DD-endopeptidase MepM/ murein hydrolase activator NlpD